MKQNWTGGLKQHLCFLEKPQNACGCDNRTGGHCNMDSKTSGCGRRKCMIDMRKKKNKGPKLLLLGCRLVEVSLWTFKQPTIQMICTETVRSICIIYLIIDSNSIVNVPK